MIRVFGIVPNRASTDLTLCAAERRSFGALLAEKRGKGRISRPQECQAVTPCISLLWDDAEQGLRITIAKLGYMGSFVSRTNPDFCRTVLRLSDSVVTNTAHCYSRHII
jgi:hypothetical protein